MQVIGSLGDGKDPVVELKVSIKRDTPATPGDIAKSELITLNSTVKEALNLILKANEDGELDVALPCEPKWKVKVALSNAENVKNGSVVCVNALLTFMKKKERPGDRDRRLGVDEVGEGDWLFPIKVIDKSSKEEYLLAYVKVIIEWVSS